MRVNRKQLIEGCILKQDIKLLTGQPIMKKKTVLNDELIKVLDAFLVQDVVVEEKLVTGEAFHPPEFVEDEEKEESIQEESFIDLYLKAVQIYKSEFLDWQAGKKVNFLEMRSILLPLFDKVIEKPSDILALHHYCSKDEYLYHHAVSVAVLASFIGRKLNFTRGEWIQIGIAGAMADSGMAKVPVGILNKKGTLTSYEYEEVKKHPIYSYKMLKGVTGVTENVLRAVLQHHEREDGSGYPLGTNGKKIHAFSQIVAVADVYHAMSSERKYRTKQSPYRVLESISKDHFGKFQHSVVHTLLNGLLNFSIGTKVRLTNGEEGEIIFVNQQEPTRPMVKLLNTEVILPLANEKQIHIEEVIVE
ncbi:HD-GYP domain-containing protein [Bacillus sp. FJAT-45350]|uniref:HD-GYP domain-containing protein n=1 Tax=Bacillus sp. FJAT-45350 TaxID=2011014 RepID=UPI000BB6C2EE|nr:HD-GYP domain-containing protein [Bacillus sp. FJAT-45350]